MEEVSYLKPVIVKMKCDKCGEGYMKVSNGTVLLSNPPKYTHVCDKCGNKAFYTKSYPCIEFEDSITGERLDLYGGRNRR